MALMTLAQAKQHLRITHDNENEDIERKVDQASAIVLALVSEEGSPSVLPEWDVANDDVPTVVQSVAMLAVTYLHEHRGDTPDEQHAFWLSLKHMLYTTGYARPGMG